MLMRLAFAVASAVRPDILIVDEALSVGDAAFQRKCFQRIESFREERTTLLFVSHNVDTVKRLCGQAVFLDQGFVKMAGQAKDVCDAYEKHLFGGQAAMPVSADIEKPKGHLDSSLNAASIEKQYGDGGACITSVQMETDTGNIANVIPEGVKFYVTYTVNFSRTCRGVKFGMMIKTVEGVPVYGTNTTGWANQQDFDCGQTASIRFALEGNLVPGTYYLNVGANHEAGEGPQFLHRRIDCLIFRITRVHNRISIGYANVFATPTVEFIRSKNPGAMEGYNEETD
jgi:lipopolysaccharide transport system ATP-binding protein